MVNDQTYGRLTPQKLRKTLRKYQKQEKTEAKTQ
jgi:NADH:ubiquinone oxidoreductase subunit E